MTGKLSDSFEGHALARLVCATGSEMRFSATVPAAPGARVEDPSLWGWAMTEQMAERADIDDVRRTALRHEALIARAGPASAHMKLVTACATTRIALIADRPDPAEVAAALVALRAAGPLAANPLRHVLAEVRYHPDPAAYRGLVVLADQLARDRSVEPGDRVSLALDLFALAGLGITPAEGQDYETVARAAAGDDPNQAGRIVGRMLAVALERAFTRAATPADQAAWAVSGQKAWLALRGQVRPGALDGLTNERLRALLIRIDDELPPSSVVSQVFQDSSAFAPRLEDLTQPVWSRRAGRGVPGRSGATRDHLPSHPGGGGEGGRSGRPAVPRHAGRPRHRRARRGGP